VRVTHQNPPKSHALALQVSYIKREKGTAYIASRDVYTMRTKGACIAFGDIAICIMKINDGAIVNDDNDMTPENIIVRNTMQRIFDVMEPEGLFIIDEILGPFPYDDNGPEVFRVRVVRNDDDDTSDFAFYVHAEGGTL